MQHVETRAPTETEKAAAVLREGPGADDKLVEAATKAAEKAAADPEASERAKRGWETRKANAEKAAEKAAEPAKAANAPAEPAKPATTEAPKPAPVESKYKAAPERFVPEAKAEWEKVPEPVRAEIDRTIKNLEQGHAKYREAAERYAPLAEFEKRSQEAYKQPLVDTLKNYVQLDELLQTDLLAGLDRIVSSMDLKDREGNPLGLRDVAAHIVGQPEGKSFQNENASLKSQLAAMERKLAQIENGFTETRKTETETRQASVAKQIEDFASKAPRWAELETHVLKALKSDFIPKTGDPAKDLEAAYKFVEEKISPAPSLSPPAPDIPATDPEAHRRKGLASVSGAPGNGSSPAARPPVPNSAREAIRMAMSRTGIASQ